LEDAMSHNTLHATSIAIKQPNIDTNFAIRLVDFALSIVAIGVLLPAEELGGADRDRTGGLLVANQALSQLSYSPLEHSALSIEHSAKPTEC
jgi:hypothetical protein